VVLDYEKRMEEDHDGHHHRCVREGLLLSLAWMAFWPGRLQFGIVPAMSVLPLTRGRM